MSDEPGECDERCHRRIIEWAYTSTGGTAPTTPA